MASLSPLSSPLSSHLALSAAAASPTALSRSSSFPAVNQRVGFEKATAEILRFFQSLNPLVIKEGFVSYDEQNFCLQPRSFTSLFDSNARFTAVQRAMMELTSKIQRLSQSISQFDPTIDACDDHKLLLLSLIRIQNVIKTVADSGFKKLSENYTRKGLRDKSTFIARSGEESSKLIDHLRTELQSKLVPFCRGFEHDILLEEMAFSARFLLMNRETYRNSLRKVSYTAADGLCLPVELIQHCLFDARNVQETNPEVIKTAAKRICMPAQARPIPWQGEWAWWEPVRIVREREETIVSHEGVWGTCEQSEEDAVNICNLYYSCSLDKKEITISCGALDSATKAEQLAIAMKRALELSPGANGRWVVHQLNSYTNERHLIECVQTHIILQEQLFKERLGNPNLSFLHFNTCYNATTSLDPFEAPKSLRNNLDSLAILSGYVQADLEALLVKETCLFRQKGDYRERLEQQCAKLAKHGQVIRVLKQQIQAQEGSDKLNQMLALADQLENTSLRKESMIPQAEEPLFREVSVDSDGEENAEKLAKELEGIQAALPEGINQLLARLLAEQDILERELRDFKTYLANTMANLLASLEVNPTAELKKAHLLLQVYDLLLSLQLKLPSCKKVSRSTEVELFLLMYRLLEIKSIIICKHGLDRSGAVRALKGSAADMERAFTEEALTDSLSGGEGHEDAAQVDALRKLFDLLINLDELRDELYAMTNTIIDQSRSRMNLFSDISDPALMSAALSSFNIRDELFRRIDQQYPAGVSTKGTLLKATQCYLEMVAGKLLGESEKTLYSTGVVGLKYHHDTGWISSYLFANPHPPDRWPMFCFVDKKVVKLVEYPKPLLASSNITNAAVSIFLRLSQHRGS